jgi:16S rRNA (guanine(966)-N(2))-methyltransferase RsmD
MKILGGTYKGRNFYMPKDVRPSQAIARQAIFDILGHDFSGLSFLELFAGSGAVGLEAISRGAERVVMVEREAKHADIIRENMQLVLGQETAAKHALIHSDAFVYIKQAHRNGQKFDVVFFDPPYGQKLAKKTLKTLMAYDILHPHCYVVAQYDRRDSLPDIGNGFLIIREKRYGASCLTFMERNGEVAEQPADTE